MKCFDIGRRASATLAVLGEPVGNGDLECNYSGGQVSAQLTGTLPEQPSGAVGREFRLPTVTPRPVPAPRPSSDW
jgi:hypothetical protein